MGYRQAVCRPPTRSNASANAGTKGKPVRERLYETALTLRGERTDCATESARRHLRWFAEIGIVGRVGDGQPARYRRNDAYFEWKRANRLRGKCSAAELTERLDALIERDRTYQERYAIPDPGDVSVLNHADLSDHEKVEAAHTEVNDWLSVRAEIRVTEQARRLWRDRPALA